MNIGDKTTQTFSEWYFSEMNIIHVWPMMTKHLFQLKRWVNSWVNK